MSIAATLLVLLVAYERFFHRPPAPPAPLLPGLVPAEVVSIEVFPAEGTPILAVRTNNTWRLVRPLSYPAQTNSIEALLTLLRETRPAARIPLADLRNRAEGKAAFGLDPERTSLVIKAGDGRQQLMVGSLTPPGDQVFVQMTGSDAICVVSADLLRLVPESAEAWRNTLVLEPDFRHWDGMTVSAGGQVVGLKMDPTNLTWRLVRPLNTRADHAHLASLIQNLRELQAHQFVTDDPRADLEVMGLQPPQLEITFTLGTNTERVLRFGRLVNGSTNLVYATGREPGSIIAVPAAPLEAWKLPPADYRDRQLVRLPSKVNRVSVTNGTGFSLRLATNGLWTIDPAGWAADAATMAQFLDRLTALRIAQFVKDVVAEPDLPAYGLGAPAWRLVFQSPGADPPLQLDFSAPKEGVVHVKRSDESAVYAVKETALTGLPRRDGEFRDRRVWSFKPDRVASLSVSSGDRAWQVLHKGENEWSLAPGSQGLVNPFAVEETVSRLGDLGAVVWTSWDGSNLAAFGLGDAAQVLSVELKDGPRYSVKLGNPAPSGHRYASVMLDGREWVFEFPAEAYDALQYALLTPAGLR